MPNLHLKSCLCPWNLLAQSLSGYQRKIFSSAAPLDVWSPSELESVNPQLIKPTKKNALALALALARVSSNTTNTFNSVV